MTRYAKALVALFTSLGTWGTTALSDGSMDAAEWFGLCGVAVATFGVFAYPNRAPDGEPADPDQSELGPHSD